MRTVIYHCKAKPEVFKTIGDWSIRTLYGNLKTTFKNITRAITNNRNMLSSCSEHKRTVIKLANDRFKES